jgi:glycerate-2-kinase
VTKTGHCDAASAALLAASGVEVAEASHPTPDAAGESAAARLLGAIRAAPTNALVLVLLSGGGSALTPLPAAGLTLADLCALSDALLGSGASIDEVNCVRKHCSSFSGGQLGACNAQVLAALALSDVPGDRPEVIASGPTVPDSSTFADALAVLHTRGLLSAVEGAYSADSGLLPPPPPAAIPAAVLARLRAGAAGALAETPKGPSPVGHSLHVIGSAALSLTALLAEARASGLQACQLFSAPGATASEGAPCGLRGDAASVGSALGAFAAHAAHARGSAEWSAAAEGLAAALRVPCACSCGRGCSVDARGISQALQAAAAERVGLCLAVGGETTVVLPAGGRGVGRGGRNTHLALAAAIELREAVTSKGEGDGTHAPPAPGLWRPALLALATDGRDGPTDAAGALVTEETLLRGAVDVGGEAGDARACLEGFDATGFFERLERAGAGEKEGLVCAGGLLRTNPTGTNVADVVCVLLL